MEKYGYIGYSTCYSILLECRALRETLKRETNVKNF